MYDVKKQCQQKSDIEREKVKKSYANEESAEKTT